MSLVSQITTLTTRIGTEFKAHANKIGVLANLNTTAKGDLVSAINELASAPGGTEIDDNAVSTSTTYSSTKISSEIASGIASLVDSAPAALDTLKEFADALGDDPDFAATTSTALGNRVRVDASQALSGPQQAQGRSNIGAQAAADIGDTSTNFVTTFESALL